jgi:TatD DNase family protein
MQLTDTHCHIHEATASLKGDEFMHSKWHKAGHTDATKLIADAEKEGVNRLICVGTTLDDSKLAVELVQQYPQCWASIGIHPHESKDHNSNEHLDEFAKLVRKPKVVAIGECGLDYYYEHSSKDQQRKILEFQLELAQKHQLPLIFHVRDAFDDFFAILDHFQGVRGVVHSFTANTAILDKCLNRGLYIGLNGIMTFTKDEAQIAAAKKAPLQNLLLETDAPFLTPKPFRGTICEPKHVRVTAEFLSDLRGESLEELATATTRNATELFNLA